MKAQSITYKIRTIDYIRTNVHIKQHFDLWHDNIVLFFPSPDLVQGGLLNICFCLCFNLPYLDEYIAVAIPRPPV